MVHTICQKENGIGLLLEAYDASACMRLTTSRELGANAMLITYVFLFLLRKQPNTSDFLLVLILTNTCNLGLETQTKNGLSLAYYV